MRPYAWRLYHAVEEMNTCRWPITDQMSMHIACKWVVEVRDLVRVWREANA